MRYSAVSCAVAAFATLGAAVLPLGTAAASEPVWAPVVVPAVRQGDIRSARTGHDYRIYVSEPAGPPPPAGYPVLYVLDGNAMFPVAAFLARRVADRRTVTGWTPPLVVGIGYPQADDFDVSARTRDYTPGEDAKPSENSGGADRFLDFIENEVKPMVARQHRIDPQRQAVFGHSFGGLLVLHAWLTRPTMFSSFLASSPSIWWNDRRVLQGLEKPLAGADSRLLMTVGSLEDQPPGGNVSREIRETLARRPMVSEARSLARRLQDSPAGKDRVRFVELEGEDHGSAWLPALTRGVRAFADPRP